MSKKPEESPNKKRKRLCLSIAEKINLLEKLDRGESVKSLIKEYGIGLTTIYDLKKQKEKLLKFYAEIDERTLLKNRKTLHKAKNDDLDRVLKEWIRQCRREHKPINSMMIMKQARIYHAELNIEGNCEYSAGWLQKFKRRHGIYYGRKSNAGNEVVEKFIDEFGRVISDDNTTQEQVYDADETSLFWRYCPRKTLTTADEPGTSEIEESEIPAVVVNPGDSNNEDEVVSIQEKMPIDTMVKLCDGLIEGLEQCSFITDQEIVSVYKIKETLLRQKRLIKQTTMEETPKRGNERNTSSSIEDPLPGPSTAYDLSTSKKKKKLMKTSPKLQLLYYLG